MTTLEEDKFVHEIRVALMAALARAEFEEDDVLKALNDISRQIENATLVRKTAASAGLQALNFTSDRALELYFDIQHGAADSGYVAKGWTDPGFRVGEVVETTFRAPVSGKWLADLREVAATNGIAVTSSASGGGTEFRLECVLYSEGFSSPALSGSVKAIRTCRRLIFDEQDRILQKELAKE
jgi:hypothetical protein